jgi:hypothetical protein
VSIEAAVRPHYLSDADELPHAPADEPLWSESYLVQAYAPEPGVGLFTHVNRAAWDPRLWNDVFVVYLPDDQFVVAKSFGAGEDPRGPGTASLRFAIGTPWREKRVRYRGAGQLVTGDVLRATGMPDGIHIGLEAELTFRGHGPAFDLGNIDDAPVGHAHYEQHGHVSGHITYGSTTVTIEGTGFRDHSWGPRDLTWLGRHVWHHGLFPSGRWFSVAEVLNPAGDAVMIRMAGTGDERGIRKAELVSAPALLDSEENAFDPFEIALDTDRGRAEIRGEVIQPMTFSWVGVNEMVLGADRRSDPSHRYFETQTRWEWDGEVGYGLTERTVYLGR